MDGSVQPSLRTAPAISPMLEAGASSEMLAGPLQVGWIDR